MKKQIFALATVFITLSLLIGCKKNEEAKNESSSNNSSATELVKAVTNIEFGGISIGESIETNFKSSKFTEKENENGWTVTLTGNINPEAFTKCAVESPVIKDTLYWYFDTDSDLEIEMKNNFEELSKSEFKYIFNVTKDGVVSLDTVGINNEIVDLEENPTSEFFLIKKASIDILFGNADFIIISDYI